MLSTIHAECTIKSPDRTQALKLAETRYNKSHALKPRSFLSIRDIDAGEMKALIQTSLDMKRKPAKYKAVLRDKAIALLFQKTSTRTRCSFETGAVEMGAWCSVIDWRFSNFTLADLEDESKVLSRYYDCVMARVLDHKTLKIMAANSEVPVINGMCNLMHPCQALSDFMTMSEYFISNLEGLRLAYVGDGNNVCLSLVQGAILLGVKMTLCSPPDYALGSQAKHELITCIDNPAEAIQGADVIYTDTWISMGSENEKEKRLAAFQKYQVNEELMKSAPKALFMHCLPAHPGHEVTPGVLRGKRSIVIDQAENRKHAQKALMKMLMES
jgi:ornithine carbamoyltransferase